jgi:hypothetical protein
MNDLSKDSTTMSAAPLPHGQTAQDADGEEDDRTQNPQTGEVIFQYPYLPNKKYL